MDHPAGYLSHLDCRICGRRAADVRGLHKHLAAAHKLDAWAYYNQHPFALQLRIRANVREVLRHEHLGPCWEYQGRRSFHNGDFGYTGQGYCQMRIAGAPTEAVHRLSLFAFTGALPVDLVLHACDYPPCCNPAHISEGSHAENMGERDERGRTIRGTEHYRSAMEVDDVHRTRLLSSWGWSNKRIARELGVSAATIDRVVKGESYKDVPIDEAFDGNIIPW